MRKLRSGALAVFGELIVVSPRKVNLLYILSLIFLSSCLLHLIRHICLLWSFLGTIILVTQVFLIPGLSSRTNLKVHPILVTPKLVKKVMIDLVSSKASGPDFIPVVLLKNCQRERTSWIVVSPYIEVELFFI